MARPGEIGRSGDLPVPAPQQLRRWGALLALAGLALPGVSATRSSAARPPVAAVDASRTEARPPEVSRGEAGAPAPWAAAVVEADGKPLPAAPPPGPVPVDGIPLPAVAAAPAGAGRPPAPSASAGRADDLVPSDREYLRPILIRYAQENGLPADVVMALAWVESSWRRSAVSDAGAVGVMQLMPTTVEFASKLLGLRSNLDPRNATSNVRMGTKFLRHLLDQSGGNLRRALIAYNQGLTSLRLKGSYGVAERHAERVLALRPQFRSA